MPVSLDGKRNKVRKTKAERDDKSKLLRIREANFVSTSSDEQTESSYSKKLRESKNRSFAFEDYDSEDDEIKSLVESTNKDSIMRTSTPTPTSKSPTEVALTTNVWPSTGGRESELEGSANDELKTRFKPDGRGASPNERTIPLIKKKDLSELSFLNDSEVNGSKERFNPARFASAGESDSDLTSEESRLSPLKKASELAKPRRVVLDSYRDDTKKESSSAEENSSDDELVVMPLHSPIHEKGAKPASSVGEIKAPLKLHEVSPKTDKEAGEVNLILEKQKVDVANVKYYKTEENSLYVKTPEKDLLSAAYALLKEGKQFSLTTEAKEKLNKAYAGKDIGDVIEKIQDSKTGEKIKDLLLKKIESVAKESTPSK